MSVFLEKNTNIIQSKTRFQRILYVCADVLKCFFIDFIFFNLAVLYAHITAVCSGNFLSMLMVDLRMFFSKQAMCLRVKKSIVEFNNIRQAAKIFFKHLFFKISF